MKKIDQMKMQYKGLLDAAQKFMDEKNFADAKAKMDEAKELKMAIEVQEQLDEEERQDLERQAKVKNPAQEDAIKQFAAAARSGFRASMSEGANEDGGYTVPEDIQTKINTYREAKDALQPLVNVLSVKAPSGARTFKKRSQQTGFAKVAEGGKIAAKETPKFERQSYAVEKYAGYFPVTNELLEDSDANITSELIKWIGDESRVTRNKIILDVIKTKTVTPLADLDDLKYAFNVTLGAEFRNTSAIITNDDGMQYLDTLKDVDGRYILQPDVTDTTRKKLFGALTVKVVSNKTMPSDTGTAGKRGIPMIIGDLKEGINFYDKKSVNIKSSDVAMNAFEEDLTLFRAIEREDCKIKDDQAFIYGVMTIDDASVTV